MATPRKPPRSWDMDDLLDIGRRSNATHLKAIPVLILEKWVLGGREEGAADFVRTKDLTRRLQSSGLLADLAPRGAASLLGCLVKKQNAGNLTRPPLIEYKRAWKGFRVGLPHYEPLLQKYRQEYRKSYPEDYRKLFPEGAPKWGYPSLPIARTGREEATPAPAGTEVLDEARSLVAPLEKALRERDQTIERLKEEIADLQADMLTMQSALQEHEALVSMPSPMHRIVDAELRNDCADLLENEKHYISAIRSASVVLEERLMRTTGGTEGGVSKHGIELVDYALRKDGGRLVISEHAAEQEGIHMLFRGAVQFVRNPPMHKKLQYTEAEARGAIGLIDYLLLLLQRAKLRQE